MCFGTDGRAPPRPRIVRAIDYAYSHDVVLVAAAADDPIEEQGDPANVLQPTGTGPTLNAGQGPRRSPPPTSPTPRASFAGARHADLAGRLRRLRRDGGAARAPRRVPAQPDRRSNAARPAREPPCNCRTTFDGDNALRLPAGHVDGRAAGRRASPR